RAGRQQHLAPPTVAPPGSAAAPASHVLSIRGGRASSHCAVGWALPSLGPADRALALVVDQLVARAGRHRIEAATASLGADAVCGRIGMTSYLQRALFSVAAQGNPAGLQPDDFATVITSAIGRIASEATSQEVTAALAAVDFRLRENETG